MYIIVTTLRMCDLIQVTIVHHYSTWTAVIIAVYALNRVTIAIVLTVGGCWIRTRPWPCHSSSPTGHRTGRETRPVAPASIYLKKLIIINVLSSVLTIKKSTEDEFILYSDMFGHCNALFPVRHLAVMSSIRRVRVVTWSSSVLYSPATWHRAMGEWSPITPVSINLS